MANILHTITKTLHEHDIAPSRFGRLAMGDPRFVTDLRNGRTLRPTTEAVVIAALSAIADGDTLTRPPRSNAIPPTKARNEGLAGLGIGHRQMMRAGSKALLAAIRIARGEA